MFLLRIACNMFEQIIYQGYQSFVLIIYNFYSAQKMNWTKQLNQNYSLS